MTTKRKKKRYYLKWFEAWGPPRTSRNFISSWSEIGKNSKLLSIFVTNISRSSPHTTSWFIEVRHQHLKTNLQGLKSHVHILIVSKSNLKLQVFGLFSRFARNINIPSSEEPTNSTSINRIRNGGKLVIIFHPSQKNITKGVDCPVENPRKRIQNIKVALNSPNKFYRRMRNEMPFCLLLPSVTLFVS